MSEAPHQPVAPLSVDTAVRPVDELDPVQRPNLAGFLALVLGLSLGAAALFAVPLVVAVVGGDAAVAAPLGFVVVVPVLLAVFARQGVRAARAQAPFQTPLRRLLWLLSAPSLVSLVVLGLYLLHVVAVAGGVDPQILDRAAASPAVSVHAAVVRALVPAALLWGPTYPIAAVALSTQSGLRSWLRAPLWVGSLIGWAVVVVVDPLAVSRLILR